MFVLESFIVSLSNKQYLSIRENLWNFHGGKCEVKITTMSKYLAKKKRKLIDLVFIKLENTHPVPLIRKASSSNPNDKLPPTLNDFMFYEIKIFLFFCFIINL